MDVKTRQLLYPDLVGILVITNMLNKSELENRPQIDIKIDLNG